jgi:hypothetical protein
MKQLRFLATAMVATSMSLFMSSCGSGDNKKTDETATTTDTATKKTEEVTPPPPPPKPSNVMVVIAKVANYAKWKPQYDAHDSARQAAGLKNYVIGRGMKDSNTVLVALKMADTAKAKAFGRSKDLMEKMKKSGVIGKPAVMYINVVAEENLDNPTTTRLRVMHKVKDWDAWKKVFDSHKQSRIDAGLLDRSVGYSVDDNHMVSLVFLVTDMAKAKAFTTSKDLKDKMTEAGVVGPPTFFWYNVVQRYQ